MISRCRGLSTLPNPSKVGAELSFSPGSFLFFAFSPSHDKDFFFLQIYKRVKRKKNVPSKYLLSPI